MAAHAAAAAGDAGQKIPYDIVYCTSEDEPFPVSELLQPDDSPGHRGWQTAKNPKYPQSLVLRFAGDVDLRQIQILSHECKIASKVEVRVFSLIDNGVDVRNEALALPSFRDARFVKLGAVGFNNNEKSKYRSKERKTVHLKATAYFLKLNFQKCHQNGFNTNQQVGVYAITCYGFFHEPAAGYPVDPPITQNHPMDHHHDDHHHMMGNHNAHHGVDNTPVRITPAPALVNNDGSGGMLPPIAGVNRPAPPSINGAYTSPPPPYGLMGGVPPYQQQFYTPPSINQSLDPLPPSANVVKLPPLGSQSQLRQQQQQNQLYQSPPEKHSTAHPHDVPNIPDSVVSVYGYSYRSHVIVEFDAVYTGRTEELVKQKARAVDEEDFDAAKGCKDALKHLHETAQQIYSLEQHKVRAIYDEDFETAKRFKTDMDSALDELYRDIPGGIERFIAAGVNAGGGGGGRYGEGGTSSPPPPIAQPPSVPRKRDTTGGGGGGASSGKKPVVEMPPVDRRRAPLVSKHSFEEEPVRSKYAIAMAQRRDEHPSDDEGAEDDREAAGQPPHENTAPPAVGTAAVRHSVDADASEPTSPLRDAGGSGDHAPTAIQPTTGGNNNVNESLDDVEGAGSIPPLIDAFDLATLPKWEQEVYRVIHAEAQEDVPAAPVPAAGPHVEAAESIRVLGNYMTACLLSKRWKLREAAIKAITKDLIHLYQHIPVANVVQIVLKFFDVKNYGLQDTIGNVFLACCEFVQKVLEDQYDKSLATVLPAALNLLPRFIARAGDAAQKTREEAASTVIAYVVCPDVGPTYVVNNILSDPIDQDKRRIPVANHRIQLARLALLQHLLVQFKYTLSPALFDTCMNKLIVPCLNHSSSEVRDLAVTVSTLLIESSYDFSKFVNQISNAAIKSTIGNALDGKQKGTAAAPAGKSRGTSAGKNAGQQPRNTSAPRKSKHRSDSEVPPE